MDKEAASPTAASYLLLAVVLALLVALLFAIWRALDALDPGVAAAVIAAIATVLISVVSLIYQRRWEQRRAVEEAQREHKRGVYEEFVRFLFRAVNEDPPVEEIQRWATDFNPKFILWAADAIVSEYAAFRQTAASLEEAENQVETLFAFERVVYAIRKDLGHPNKELSRGDLLRVFVSDIDDHIVAASESTISPS